jgi:hypothetical protein
MQAIPGTPFPGMQVALRAEGESFGELVRRCL